MLRRADPLHLIVVGVPALVSCPFLRIGLSELNRTRTELAGARQVRGTVFGNAYALSQSGASSSGAYYPEVEFVTLGGPSCAAARPGLGAYVCCRRGCGVPDELSRGRGWVPHVLPQGRGWVPHVLPQGRGLGVSPNHDINYRKGGMVMDEFLGSSEIVDWEHPAVRRQAAALAEGAADSMDVARRCFEWVRDEIRHSRDYQLNPVTCTASEVLAAGTGYCYAKSHLLAALLRANGIPAGLCYQRLSIDDQGAPYSLHGLNAVYLPEHGWYRVDPRGNKPGVDAQFTPPQERLAFPITLPGEADLPGIHPDPLPVVVQALRSHATWDALLANLPDEELGTRTRVPGS